MTDVTVEILNLDKKESITIDILSNQDFTEVMKILCKMFLISLSICCGISVYEIMIFGYNRCLVV